MKITLTLPDGQTATIADSKWESPNPQRAALLDSLTVGKGGASYLPHPMLAVAEDAAAFLNASIDIEDAPEMDPPNDGFQPIH